MPERSNRAFSLIEVLVAAAILTACFIPVVALTQRGLTESGVTQEDILGRQILMDLCERYKSSAPGELLYLTQNPDRIETDNLVMPLRASTSTIAQLQKQTGGLVFRRSIDLDYNFSGEKGLHKLTFLVKWTGRNGRERQVSLSRLIHFHDDSLPPKPTRPGQ